MKESYIAIIRKKDLLKLTPLPKIIKLNIVKII